MDSMPCTLIIPAAGDSVRFQEKTAMPKGLVRFGWNGRSGTMIEHVVPSDWDGDVIVGCKQADKKLFTRRLPASYYIVSMPPTTGQAETVRNLAYEAPHHWDCIVVNCDNAFKSGTLRRFVDYCRESDAICGALTFMPDDDYDRYGYVNAHPNFSYGTEKVRISKWALAGAFYFKSPRKLTQYMPLHTRYLSESFMTMPKPKVSMEIRRSDLYEWGTAELLEKSVGNIDWQLA